MQKTIRFHGRRNKMSEKKIKKGILVLAGLILAVFLIGTSKGGRFSDWPILGSFFDQNLFPSKVKVGPPENESEEEGENQEKEDSDKPKAGKTLTPNQRIMHNMNRECS